MNRFTLEGYKKEKDLYLKGIITQEEWNCYCKKCLKFLMKKHQDVLDRLKNC